MCEWKWLKKSRRRLSKAFFLFFFFFCFFDSFFLLEKRSPHFSLSLSLLIRVFLFSHWEEDDDWRPKDDDDSFERKETTFSRRRHSVVVVVSWCEIQKECTHSTTRWVLLLTTFGDTNSKFRITTLRRVSSRAVLSSRGDEREKKKGKKKKTKRTRAPRLRNA